IELQAETSKLGASRLAYLRRILSNSGSEDERINASQHRDHCSDSSLQTVHIHVECQFGSRMTLFHGCQDLAHVSGKTGDAKQPRPLIEHIINLVWLQLTLTQQVSKNSGIDRTGAS